MDLEVIRERIRAGKYLIKTHAVQHALKEGFDREHLLEAILGGMIIEDYEDQHRVLICGWQDDPVRKDADLFARRC